MPVLRINPALDVAGFAEAYAREQCVQIPDFFEPDTAIEIERALASLPWRLLVQDDGGRNVMLTRDQVAALSAEQREALSRGMADRAARNLGYSYQTYPMVLARLENWDPGHPIHALTDFLNSPPFFAFARQLIRCPGLTKTDAHATRYGPGHYLTRHQDDGFNKERRAAYTLGFSRRWEPDWGGLLLFLDGKQDVERGLVPRFNVLTVFDGLKTHTVTQVASFAPAPRLTVAGWFRDDPPAGRR
jgi:SM-20-related protein